jgi:chorismate dehydratase
MIRLSVIPYVNALPLTHYLPQVCADAMLTSALPSESLTLLDSGKVDAALVPVADVMDRTDIHVCEGLGICAHGAVTSVLMQSHRPVGTIRTVQLDPASRTSNCLARVLFAFHWQTRPEFVASSERADAEIIIGDRALKAPPTTYTYDLSEQWTQMTGLPFVFAVWACHREYQGIERLAGILKDSLDRGIKAYQRVAAEAATRTGLSFAACHHYLSECLHYRVGPDEQRAMQAFKRYAQQLSQGQGAGICTKSTYARGDVHYARVVRNGGELHAQDHPETGLGLAAACRHY